MDGARHPARSRSLRQPVLTEPGTASPSQAPQNRSGASHPPEAVPGIHEAVVWTEDTPVPIFRSLRQPVLTEPGTARQVWCQSSAGGGAWHPRGDGMDGRHASANLQIVAAAGTDGARHRKTGLVPVTRRRRCLASMRRWHGRCQAPCRCAGGMTGTGRQIFRSLRQPVLTEPGTARQVWCQSSAGGGAWHP